MKKFSNCNLTQAQAEQALSEACEIVKANVPMFTDCCQDHSSVGDIYPQRENDEWTCGFWPGELWLSYEHTNDAIFKETALVQVESFVKRIENKVQVDHHDMGFLYTPSCVAAYQLVGSEEGKQAAIAAADQLITRFQPKGEFLQAWGAMDEVDNYRYIIDCMLNVPLLYWASKVTGNDKYREIGTKHTVTCLANSFREDGSTHHTFFMNADGTPKCGRTCQGYRDDSFWARGQAWGIYGSAIGYTYTQNDEFKDVFKKALDFYLSRLPEDLVPCWDMIFAPETGEPRDSSSAAIVACGLLEMAKHETQDVAQEYRELAGQMLASLVDCYAVKMAEFKPGIGLVKHGTYGKKSPYNTCNGNGVDECVSWGDYFYMEALTRYMKDWAMYW
ncbi:MAG: glycoside hydrolase family 88 protein [Faecalibacterium sp.]